MSDLVIKHDSGGNESTDFPEILHLELIDFVIDLVKETSTCTNLCRVILNHSLCVGENHHKLADRHLHVSSLLFYLMKVVPLTV